MKKLFVLLIALAVMGGAIAQDEGTKKNNQPTEYVSVLLTFSNRNIPMDSLNAYGVKIQNRTGIIAYALIPAENYEAFLQSGICDRVQPSTRVFLNEDFEEHDHHQCSHHKNHPGCPHHGEMEEEGDPRQNLIPEDQLDDEDARGFYLGILLGDSRNQLRIESIDLTGVWYPSHGIDGELLLGYQFNSWFGLRTAAQFMYKNYSTDLKVEVMNSANQIENKKYSTNYSNMYLQAPLFADFSFGGSYARMHFLLGGYVGYWVSQYREGYVYSPFGTSGLGWMRGFEEKYNQHLDAGLAGGIGFTFQITPAIQLHVEGAYYHGLLSTTSDYDLTDAQGNYSKTVINKTYNRTYTINMGISYHF